MSRKVRNGDLTEREVQPKHLYGGTEKNHEKFQPDGESQGRDSNSETTENEAGVPTTRQPRSVDCWEFNLRM